MDLNQSLDNYCERTSAAFFSEPVNFLSNFAFLLAAFLAYRYARKLHGGVSKTLIWLCAWLFLVGIGSALFHSFATKWALLADVIPIQVFILSFFGFWLAFVLRLSLPLSLLGMCALYALTEYLSEALSRLPLNGSEGYFGTLLALYLLALHQRLAKADSSLLLAAILLTLSLVARTIDAQICPQFPLGTHFLWHLLNAGVCYLAIISYARSATKLSEGVSA